MIMDSETGSVPLAVKLRVNVEIGLPMFCELKLTPLATRPVLPLASMNTMSASPIRLPLVAPGPPS